MSRWLGLEGARVLVVGAGSIGAAVAEGFGEVGSSVAVADRDPQRLAGLASRAAATLEVDVTSADACRAAVDRAADALGGLDVFVHSVGINRRKGFEDLTDHDWDDILTVNLASAFWLAQAAARRMRAQRSGRIVFVSSVSGLLAHRHHAPYAASKGGMNQLARVLAHELAADGVTVNAIAPGYTETGLTRDYLDRDGNRERLTALVPAGRLGSVGELVGPVLFLASPQAGFITGQVLYVDGGRTLV